MPNDVDVNDWYFSNEKPPKRVASRYVRGRVVAGAPVGLWVLYIR